MSEPNNIHDITGTLTEKMVQKTLSWLDSLSEDDFKTLKLLLDTKVRATQAENEKLRECVKWYADRKHWWRLEKGLRFDITDESDVNDDESDWFGGKRARECLAELEGK
jgi:hypothetical protein